MGRGAYFKASLRHCIISLVHRKVFPLWFSSCLALETAVDVVLKRPVSERACDLFYNKVYPFNGSRLFL